MRCIPLSVTNPKQFSVAAPRSLAKSWLLKVDYLVRVVPGLNTTLTIKGGE